MRSISASDVNLPIMPQTVAGNPATAIVDDPRRLAQLAKQCVADRLPIVDYGFAHRGLGHPPPARHLKIVQRGGVIEHYQRDLTVLAAAGATIRQVQSDLQAANQFLPIDADDDLTLGEVIAHNVYGPLRVGYGAARDLLLGLNYLDGWGRDIHVGGRTVKNVAGYDVTRFMVGSLGELGCVYEATLRTSAVPESILSVDLQLENPATLDAVLTDWLVSDAAPTYLSLHLDSREWRVCLGYFGQPEGCRAQFEALRLFLTAHSPETAIVGHREHSLEQDGHGRAQRRRWRRQASALVKLIVPPACTGAVCRDLIEKLPHHPRLRIEAFPVHGCVFAGGDLDAAQAGQLDRHASQLVQSVNGLRVWHARPAGAESIDPWGPAQPDWSILTRLKHTMDPLGIFNPGRFLPVSAQEQPR